MNYSKRLSRLTTYYLSVKIERKLLNEIKFFESEDKNKYNWIYIDELFCVNSERSMILVVIFTTIHFGLFQELLALKIIWLN